MSFMFMKNPLHVLVVGTILIVAFFELNRRQCFGLNLKPDELSALFTGLGFIGIIATLRHEKTKSEAADKAQIDLLNALTFNTQSLNGQRIQITRAAYVDALSSAFGIAGSHPMNGTQEKIREEINMVMRLLHRDGHVSDGHAPQV